MFPDMQKCSLKDHSDLSIKPRHCMDTLIHKVKPKLNATGHSFGMGYLQNNISIREYIDMNIYIPLFKKKS